jgi:hypothetical protein
VHLTDGVAFSQHQEMGVLVLPREIGILFLKIICKLNYPKYELLFGKHILEVGRVIQTR